MKNKKLPEKVSYGKYFLTGAVIAAIILVISYVSDNESVPVEKKMSYVWSAETDSLFVKNCYDKYKPQVKDDMTKQETMKAFCRCMLEKVKSKYEEKDIGKVSNADIKNWDTECRKQIMNSNFLK